MRTPTTEAGTDLMDDAELIERLTKYRGKPGEREQDVICLANIFAAAGIYSGNGYHIMDGTDKIGTKRRIRLTRAVIMAETGMIRKVNGKVIIGPATRPMPARLHLKMYPTGLRIEKVDRPPAGAELMPTFTQVFGRKP